MIPTMILFGLVLGRWWRLALVSAAVGWPALLVLDGIIGSSVDDLAGAALFGGVNAAVGILVHQGTLWLVRHRNPPPASASSLDSPRQAP